MKENAGRVTMRDIAEALGLSKTAVSLGLRGDPSIPEARRAQIRKVAEDMGYRPDPVRASLAANRWRDPPEGIHSSLAILYLGDREMHPLKYRSIEDQAEALGYHLDSLWLRDFSSQQKAFDVIRARGIRGVILSPPESADFELTGEVSDLALVTGPFGYRQLPIATVTPNLFRGMILCLRQLHDLGYRRPGLQLGVATPSRNEEMLFGAYQSEWKLKRKYPTNPPPVFSGNDLGGIRKWIDKHRIDVVLAETRGLLDRLREEGVEIPESLGYVALDRDACASPVAGLSQCKEAAGHQTVILLDSLIRSHQFGLPARTITLLVDPQWHDGPTLVDNRSLS